MTTKKAWDLARSGLFYHIVASIRCEKRCGLAHSCLIVNVIKFSKHLYCPIHAFEQN